MVLQINRVDTDVELMPEELRPPTADGLWGNLSPQELMARLRPLVLEILETELQRLRRERL